MPSTCSSALCLDRGGRSAAGRQSAAGKAGRTRAPTRTADKQKSRTAGRRERLTFPGCARHTGGRQDAETGAVAASPSQIAFCGALAPCLQIASPRVMVLEFALPPRPVLLRPQPGWGVCASWCQDHGSRQGEPPLPPKRLVFHPCYGEGTRTVKRTVREGGT